MTLIPLPEWIQRARVSISKEDYNDCAVKLALELTNRLCLVAGINIDGDGRKIFNSSLSSWNDLDLVEIFDHDLDVLVVPPSPSKDENADEPDASEQVGISPFSLVVQIEDIVTENVMVSVSNKNTLGDTVSNFMADEVDIQPAESNKGVSLGTQQAIRQDDVCFALGNILFEIFSRGNPLLLDELSSSVGYDNEASFIDLLLGDGGLNIEDGTSPFPAPKRTSSNATASKLPASISLMVNASLQEKGLPRSICQLVSDLLEAENENLYQSDTALLSLEEARFDLMQMRAHPQRFLHDDTCPQEALGKTSLFTKMDGEIYGREGEIKTLVDAASRVSMLNDAVGVIEGKGSLCEAFFLSGHSGSGKSSIVKQFVCVCSESDWFVLACKFDRQVAPLSVLLQSFDAFFGKFIPIQGDDGHYLQREHWVQSAFDRISRSITSLIDGESYCQLCDLIPNLGKLFSFPINSAHGLYGRNDGMDEPFSSSTQRSTSPGVVGSGRNRLNYLFHTIFKVVCSGGCPITIVVDDLQWADAATMDILGDFVESVGCGFDQFSEKESLQPGLILVGSFRSNEVDADGFVMNQIKCMEQSNQRINVNMLSIGGLPEHEINKMLSFKFCLPMRHTRELARLVFQKTRGMPMYIVEFLRSIIKRDMITFSVKSRRWILDEDSIDVQMISEGVVELLTRKLQQLPHHVIESLKVLSCLGQANVSTIELLDLGQFVPDLAKSLGLAMEEGIVEKAGPLYAFSHDMLQESTYHLIPIDARKTLHKMIGQSLVLDPGILENDELCTLAADQIALYNDMDGLLDPSQRALFVRVNLAAGKFSTHRKSYCQARRYFEAGISLLHTNAWDRQYKLCLELSEMSVIASFSDGSDETISSRLSDIISHAKSFEDALTSRALRAKFLASQAQYAEAASELLGVLSNLGEEFPRDASLSHVKSEIKATQLMLKDATKEKILNLPPMTDMNELYKMKFMGLLYELGNFGCPMLLPLLSCRMIRMTFEFGACEHTIPALVFMATAVIFYSDDSMLASRISRIAEQLINGDINQHSLRARLTQMIGSVKAITEPSLTTVDHFVNGYNSAKIVGDIDNAALCGLTYCVTRFFVSPDLLGLQKFMVNFFQEMVKHKRIGLLHSAMSYFFAVADLVGNSCKIDARIEMKNNKELYHIAEQTQSTYLMHHVVTNQMYVHCYYREHLPVLNFGEEYRRMKDDGTTRTLDFAYIFFEGISALCLARDTKQEKWRTIGEKCVQAMSEFVKINTWNFENKLCLLQAELHYLNHRHTMADITYRTAITSSHDHKFFQEEALACELYGIFLVENKTMSKGIDQLTMAMDMYKKWGATKRSNDVKDFINLVCKPLNLWKSKT